MAPHFQLEPAKYALVLSGARFTDVARNRHYFGVEEAPGPIFDVARQASDIWLAAKMIEIPVEPKAIITTKFVTGGGS